ncbi:PQQ-dependent sugar dehydrogenase [Maribacter confluentis]|uniref:PQQ-dependent sugar dehydrogenase n=1 Tax=Maribacter confluentis TaxID=1656093 RepID=A0ABT8RLC2_9FLAO|nr:PQQ-dependent sugar dehydrogenase [Maribacter confluentis]MDO1511736.1 PQQ-dependent sugar dehydrogenase [Maribacter confluentis]
MNKLLLHFLFFLCFALSGFSQEKITYEDAFPNLNFQFPVEIQNANDGSNRLFVVEQQGAIKVFENVPDTNRAILFLDIEDIVSFSSGQEIGLLGLAFHPNYKSNGYFFVYHTQRSSVSGVGVEVVLARYRVDPLNPNSADKLSRLEIFSFDKNQNNSNHNGGKIGFGPDGYLYISVGDGGGGGDPMGNAQNLENIFGSILRIDVDLDNSNPLETNPDLPNGNYEIPTDNPRVGKTGLDELYSWGIRNTWKFSFDGDMLIGADVGQDNYEEINVIVNGGNYGWSRLEGDAIYKSSTTLATKEDVKPIFQYDHSFGDRSITGGYVYNGKSENTLIKGKYIYADYVTGRVWALNIGKGLDSVENTLLFRTNGQYVSSFGLDEDGEMYFSSYGNAAKIFKISGGDEPEDNGPLDVSGIGYWTGITESTNGVINCIFENGDDIYVGGSFTSIGETVVNNLGVYNKKTGWKNTLGNVNGEVKTITMNADNELLIGGTFSNVNGIAANNIALWNGNTWSAMGSGTNGTVAKIAVDSQSKIYVGGAFVNAGGIEVNNIAIWENGWQAIMPNGSLISGLNNEVREIVIDDNDVVYVGGNFDTAGITNTPRIATWNGSEWGTLANGTSGFVEAMALDDSFVYVGGNFNIASGETVNRIARWNLVTKEWETLGNGLSGSVNSIVANNDEVFVAGNFVFASNEKSETIIVNNIAKWSEIGGWQPLGENLQVGTDGVINSILFSAEEEQLYVTGNFSKVGDITSNFFATWSMDYRCPANSIVQEYQVNGVWESGKDVLELDEGDKLVLSILPNTELFTIILPDGEEVKMDYTIDSVNVENEGLYTFKTDKGCEATLELKIIPKPVCDLTSIQPEYQIGDGPWVTITEETLTIAEGLSLGLRLKEIDQDYSITTPQGELIENGLSISAISVEDLGEYVFATTEDCTKTLLVDYCDNESIEPEFKIGEGAWVKNEVTTVVDEGSVVSIGLPVVDDAMYTVTSPSGLVTNGVLVLDSVFKDDEGEYRITMGSGCFTIFTLNVISSTVEVCIDELRNENTELPLPNGIYYEEYLQVEKEEIDTNGFDCSLRIATLQDGRLWERYIVTIDLETLGLVAGDNLRFSLDGKSDGGNARIEVAQDNKPNNWLLGHTFGNEWATYTKTIKVPNDISTLNIWLYSNYATLEKGAALFDNLVVEKILDIEEPGNICENPLGDLRSSLIIEEEKLTAGLDISQGVEIEEVGDCVLEVTNEDENQPWARYTMSINLEDNGLQPGDVLEVTVDGVSLDGNARIEIAQDNLPNIWLLGHTFSNEWTTYEQEIIVPENITTLDIWLFSNYANIAPGTSMFNNLTIQKQEEETVPQPACGDTLTNIYDEIELTNGRLDAGLDTAGNIADSNLGLGCIFEIANSDQNQPWARYSITIDLEANGIGVGDVLEFSIDGKTIEGNARIEVAQNNRPNAWQIGHNFTTEWSTYSGRMTILPLVRTLDIWLFSNYAQGNETGLVQFTNLSVRKVEEDIVLPFKSTLGTDNDAEMPITVYPNPTASWVSVDTSVYDGQELALNLISPNNVILYSRSYDKYRKGTIDVDLSQYQPGVYIISLTTGNGNVHVEKVIKN